MNKEKLYARIQEIITLSKDAIKQNDYITINHFAIDRAYEEEFRSLLETENVMFFREKIESGEINTSKQCRLIDLCRSKLDTKYSVDYQRIIEILENVDNLDCTEVMTKDGYFIPRKDYQEFDKLCRTLMIGIHSLANTKTDAELSLMVHAKLQMDTEQRDRIKNFVPQVSEEKCMSTIEVNKTDASVVNITPEEYIKVYTLVYDYAKSGVSLDNIYEALVKTFKSYEIASNIIDECVNLGYVNTISYTEFLKR